MTTNEEKRMSRLNPEGKGLTDSARQALIEWDESQQINYFTADLNFQRTLEFHWGKDEYSRRLKRLYKFGEILAKQVDSLVSSANLEPYFPELKQYDAWGSRQDDVVFHPAHHEAGRLIYQSGVVEVFEQKNANLLGLALFYLSAQMGEAGHNCAIACTVGLVKVLQTVANDEIKERYLPRLLSADYDQNFTGAQFLTEIQGGSDVGANDTQAVPTEIEGIWLLNGEKWFCSNITADLALVTARVPGQDQGTDGLGLFLVPRFLQGGGLNTIRIRALKNKIGTRSLATAEVELDDAIAYAVGSTRDGFRNVMEYVINTSRLYTAFGACGNARRAYKCASTYALHRRAFGRAIVHFPIVQDILANMRADGAAILSGSLHIARYMDEAAQDGESENHRGFLRMAINLNKYRATVLARSVILNGIEILGGNGTIEEFSPMPRLLRDNVVYENWEGTHNVLLAQLQRDMRRYEIHQPFFTVVRDQIEKVGQGGIRDEITGVVAVLERELDEVLDMDELTAGIYFRPLMNRTADLYYSACMLAEAQWELSEKNDRTKHRIATLFFNRRALSREPKDIAYYDDLVSRLCSQ